MHADFGLPLPMMRHTEFPHYYRRHEEGESEEAFATRMAGALDKLIVEEDPDLGRGNRRYSMTLTVRLQAERCP
jgi:hypothetical protein